MFIRLLERLAEAVSAHRRLVAALGVLLFLAWLAAGTVEVASAYREGKTAQARLNAARADLSGAGLTAGAPIASLRLAAAELDQVADRVNGPWALAIRAVPWVGGQIAAVGSLANSGARIATVTGSAVSQVHTLLGQHPVGEARVTELRALVRIAGTAQTALEKVRVVGASGLVLPVQRRRNELASELSKGLATLDTARVTAAAAAQLLQGPTRYLLLVDNNGEMRAGSGTFLTAGLLTGANGKLSVSGLSDTASLALPPGKVPISGDLAARWGWLHPNEEWRNLGTTPRFPATAALAARMWKAYSGQTVQGVVAVDIPTFKEILAVTGPIQVGSHHFTSADVESYLIHDQYAGASFNPAQDAPRNALLHQLATTALHDLESGGVSLSRASKQLGTLVSGRHLLVWSAAPQTESAWTQCGVSGDLTGHDLALALINRGGNKLDQYMHISATLSVHPGREGTEVAVGVRVANRTPPGQAPYVAGPNPALPGIPYGVYTGLLSLDIPGDAHLQGISGVRSLDAAGPDGPEKVYAAALSIRPGATAEVVYQFLLPPGADSMVVDASARVNPTVWNLVGSSFQDVVPHAVSW